MNWSIHYWDGCSNFFQTIKNRNYICQQYITDPKVKVEWVDVYKLLNLAKLMEPINNEFDFTRNDKFFSLSVPRYSNYDDVVLYEFHLKDLVTNR